MCSMLRLGETPPTAAPAPPPSPIQTPRRVRRQATSPTCWRTYSSAHRAAAACCSGLSQPRSGAAATPTSSSTSSTATRRSRSASSAPACSPPRRFRTSSPTRPPTRRSKRQHRLGEEDTDSRPVPRRAALRPPCTGRPRLCHRPARGGAQGVQARDGEQDDAGEPWGASAASCVLDATAAAAPGQAAAVSQPRVERAAAHLADVSSAVVRMVMADARGLAECGAGPRSRDPDTIEGEDRPVTPTRAIGLSAKRQM